MTDERFNLIVALYCLCNDYHSGQWSRGYRILSRIVGAYKPHNIPSSREELDDDQWLDAANKYDELKARYENKL